MAEIMQDKSPTPAPAGPGALTPFRRSAWAGLLTGQPGMVAFTPAPDAARFVLRGPQAAREAASACFHVDLPDRINRAQTEGSRAALKLGPDEWLLIAPGEEAQALFSVLNAAVSAAPGSLVDVSHREAGLIVLGPGTADVLNGAMPLDLDPEAFPVGMATRTVLGKAEIVLWRVSEDCFHVEMRRSFVPYAIALLAEIRAEIS